MNAPPENIPDRWIEARDVAVQAALDAWIAIEPLYHGQYQVTEKPDGPATDADRLADRLIAESIRAAFPSEDHAFLTEESEDNLARLEARYVWIIDPIDGTRDFIRRNGNFAIHIAMVERAPDGTEWLPAIAVVYRPVAKHMYTAMRGGGAWRQDVRHTAEHGTDLTAREPIRVSARAAMGELRSVVSNSHRTSLLTRLIETLGLEHFWHIGSLGVKVCIIAEGEAELYINIGLGKTKEWDTCAPLLILQEAGGKVTDLRGEPLRYNQSEVRHMHGLLASNGPPHAMLLEQINTFLGKEGRLPLR